MVTGGTGSLGTTLIQHFLNDSTVELVTVFSRDELKQYHLQQTLGHEPRVDFMLGDIRDSARLSEVFASHDTVVHTAALKQVVMGEHNPLEYILTNILGTVNVVDAAVKQNLERALIVSTDKAASAVNLYGGTKFVADKYVTRTATDSRKVRKTGLKLSVIRFGNFLNSRGSVIPLWRDLLRRGRAIPVTDPEMTRFWLPLEVAADHVVRVLEIMEGGEIFVPRCRSITIGDLVTAVAPDATVTVLGRRLGEKLHEELVSEIEMASTIETRDFFIIFGDGSSRAMPQSQDSSRVSSISSDDPQFAISPDEMRRVIAELPDTQ